MATDIERYNEMLNGKPKIEGWTDFWHFSRRDVWRYFCGFKKQLQDAFGYDVWEYEPTRTTPQIMRGIMAYSPRMMTPIAGAVFRMTEGLI